ncbi:MAG TPA: hypothetical protein VHR47_02915 [Bacillota bacterium]|nr:hypothetical protein [Bacillota bacterium]
MNKCLDRKRRISLLMLSLLLLAALIFTLSTYAAEKPVTLSSITVGQPFYTQFSMFYENHIHKTTNYRKGSLLQVNTAVKFVKSDNDCIVVSLPDGQQLTIQNVANFSGEKIDGIFARTFSTKPQDLSVFTEAERKSIMLGEIKVGMRKAATLVALGYPPKHKTPSLDGDRWQYWSNRFNTFVVYFSNGKVSKIQD